MIGPAATTTSNGHRLGWPALGGEALAVPRGGRAVRVVTPDGDEVVQVEQAQCSLCRLKKSTEPSVRAVVEEVERLWMSQHVRDKAILGAVAPLMEGWPPEDRFSRWDIRRHGERHLGFEAYARRKLAEEMATRAGAVIQEGAADFVTAWGGLEAAAREASRSLLAGEHEARNLTEAIAAINAKAEFEREYGGQETPDHLVAMIIRLMQSFRDVIPREYWVAFNTRFTELWEEGFSTVPEAGGAVVAEPILPSSPPGGRGAGAKVEIKDSSHEDPDEWWGGSRRE